MLIICGNFVPGIYGNYLNNVHKSIVSGKLFASMVIFTDSFTSRDVYISTVSFYYG